MVGMMMVVTSKNLEECDIDKISKIIMDMGRKNPFPDITVQ